MNQIAEIRESERQEEQSIALTRGDVTRMTNQIQLMKEFVHGQLKKNQHFYEIKGNKSLNKAGAENVLSLYNCYARPKNILERPLSNGHFEITVEVEIVHRATGRIVGSGSGSCNSREKKYAFSANNPDDLRNTVLKMGKKRAVVDGTLYIGCVSEFFTQDLEDMEFEDNTQPPPKQSEQQSNNLFAQINTLRDELGVDKDELKRIIPGDYRNIDIQQKALNYLNELKSQRRSQEEPPEPPIAHSARNPQPKPEEPPDDIPEETENDTLKVICDKKGIPVNELHSLSGKYGWQEAGSEIGDEERLQFARTRIGKDIQGEISNLMKLAKKDLPERIDYIWEFDKSGAGSFMLGLKK